MEKRSGFGRIRSYGGTATAPTTRLARSPSTALAAVTRLARSHCFAARWTLRGARHNRRGACRRCSDNECGSGCLIREESELSTYEIVRAWKHPELRKPVEGHPAGEIQLECGGSGDPFGTLTVFCCTVDAFYCPPTGMIGYCPQTVQESCPPFIEA